MSTPLEEIRVAGADLPKKAHLRIGLRKIFGVGNSRAIEICKNTGLSPEKKCGELTIEQVEALRSEVAKFKTGDELKREIILRIEELKRIRCYRAGRLIAGLPARGQRTRSNARTAKKLRAGHFGSKSSAPAKAKEESAKQS